MVRVAMRSSIPIRTANTFHAHGALKYRALMPAHLLFPVRIKELSLRLAISTRNQHARLRSS